MHVCSNTQVWTGIPAYPICGDDIMYVDPRHVPSVVVAVHSRRHLHIYVSDANNFDRESTD